MSDDDQGLSISLNLCRTLALYEVVGRNPINNVSLIRCTLLIVAKSRYMPMVIVETDYIAVGGNRHPAAADWDPVSGLIGFGADRNIALWKPLVRILPTH